MIVMLAGPIKHWWDCWDSVEHREYIQWRHYLSAALVKEGHLVYRPHEAFKGQWDERAQLVNDAALANSDCVLNLTPHGVSSHGTDDEVDYARRYNKTVINCPPIYTTDDFRVVSKLAATAWACELAFHVGQARASIDMAKIARDLLWVIDSGVARDSSIPKDIIEEARLALGVYTAERLR